MTEKTDLPVGLLFPMEFEAQALWKKISGSTGWSEGFVTRKGKWRRTEVVSARIGMGRTGLTEKVSLWLRANPCRAVVLAGLAGALDPAWEEGDLTMTQAEAWPVFADWAKGQPSLRSATWHTAHEIIGTGAAKVALGQKTGCGIVEMEWDYVAAACGKERIPLVGLRAVSDHSDRLLPADLFLLGCDGESGKSTPGKLAVHLLTRPWRLRELIPAAMACTQARDEMSRSLSSFLDSLS